MTKCCTYHNHSHHHKHHLHHLLQAELLFDKSKKAHEVLCDPHRRAIYDTMGVKGLETDGWEVVQRTKTPQEIREEYERLAQVRRFGFDVVCDGCL